MSQNAPQFTTYTLLFSIVILFLVPYVLFAQTASNYDVGLLWWGNTHTFDEYQGKALIPEGGSGTVVALVNGSFVTNPSDSYVWTLNKNQYSSRSGTDANVFSFGNALFVNDVKLEIYRNNEVIGQASLQIRTKDPEVHIYERSPLAGINYSQHIVGEYVMDSPEVTFRVEPLFFPLNAGGGIEQGFAQGEESPIEWRISSAGVGDEFEYTVVVEDGSRAPESLLVRAYNALRNEFLEHEIDLTF